jgi:hypothetical protein
MPFGCAGGGDGGRCACIASIDSTNSWTLWASTNLSAPLPAGGSAHQHRVVCPYQIVHCGYLAASNAGSEKGDWSSESSAGMGKLPGNRGTSKVMTPTNIDKRSVSYATEQVKTCRYCL